MKIIITVLVIAALGAGAYFYFTKKQKPSSPNSKELIAGNWKIDSVDFSKSKDSSLALALVVTDSNLHNYQFAIDTSGLIVQSLNGKASDTSHYEFANDKEVFVWSKRDTAKTKWQINKLDLVNLVVQDKDSLVFSFQKIEK